jgi:hypothetical protein
LSNHHQYGDDGMMSGQEFHWREKTQWTIVWNDITGSTRGAKVSEGGSEIAHGCLSEASPPMHDFRAFTESGSKKHTLKIYSIT